MNFWNEILSFAYPTFYLTVLIVFAKNDEPRKQLSFKAIGQGYVARPMGFGHGLRLSVKGNGVKTNLSIGKSFVPSHDII